MPAPEPQPQLVPSSPPGFVRIEYLGFRNVGEHREFRLRVCEPDGATEFRFSIATAAFAGHRVSLQDGPDVCYQKLLRVVAAGDAASAEPVEIDDAELARYRTAHTPVPRRRSPIPPTGSPTPARVVAPRRHRESAPRMPVAPPAGPDDDPGFEEGQRVSHAVFGAGVTTASSGGRTVIRFDHDGPRTFVTAMLEVEVLSAPHTWETGPRGHNRLRD